MFASTKQGGQCMGMPDVCNTPTAVGPIPVPYPNMAMCNQARGDTVSKKVMICSKEVLTKKSIIAQTTGDEAGSQNGVISGIIRGPAKYLTYSSKVFVEGQAVVYLGCTTAHNGNNANCPVGNQIAPSQTKVLIGG